MTDEINAADGRPATARNVLDVQLSALIDRGWTLMQNTTGYLSEREARFLMTAAALAPAAGDILEVGSFKGRSTIGLAYIARECHLGRVIAIDPHTAPATTDPDLSGQGSSFDDFVSNLRRSGVIDTVDIRRACSRDVASTWDRALRLLWIDGDHTYEGALADLEMFRPYLVSGAVVAMHDVLGTFEGVLKVFTEEILASDDFGPAGLCGSIGWAQYCPGNGGSLFHRAQRAVLAAPLRQIIPIARRGRRIQRVTDEYAYKLWRALAPHGAVSPRQLAQRLVLGS